MNAFIHAFVQRFINRTYLSNVVLPVTFTKTIVLIRANKVAEKDLTHLHLGTMSTISQTTVSNEFSWMKMFEFLLTFHWFFS